MKKSNILLSIGLLIFIVTVIIDRFIIKLSHDMLLGLFGLAILFQVASIVVIAKEKKQKD